MMRANPGSRAAVAERALPCVLACSGSSAAGELADRVARHLGRMGAARMSCLAGVGGRTRSILATIRAAPKLMVIDGCPLECGARALRLAGIGGFEHFRLHELGVRKHGVEVTEATVGALAAVAGTRLDGEERT